MKAQEQDSKKVLCSLKEVDFSSRQLTFHSRLPDGWQVVYQLNHEKSKLDLAEEFTFVLSLGCVMVK